jgi:hypothetical protein
MKRYIAFLSLYCLVSAHCYACWQTAHPPVRITTVSLNGRASVDDKPEKGIRLELRRAITFNREEGWKTRLWEPKTIKSATTDSSGKFELGEIPPGRYWLLVAKGSMNFPVEVVDSYGKPPYKRLWYKYFADGCEELLVEDVR